VGGAEAPPRVSAQARGNRQTPRSHSISGPLPMRAIETDMGDQSMQDQEDLYPSLLDLEASSGEVSARLLELAPPPPDAPPPLPPGPGG
jgi:hypothetical protein